MDDFDHGMDLVLNQAPAPPSSMGRSTDGESRTEVMLDAVDDYMGADFGNLEDFHQLQYSFPEQPQQEAKMEPAIQDPSLAMDSFGSIIGGTPRPAGSMDALGLAGLEFDPTAVGVGLATAAPGDPTPPPMGFFGAPMVPDAPPSMMSWDVQLKTELAESPGGSIASADGTGSAGPGSVSSFAGSDAGDYQRRRSDASDSSASASTTPTGGATGGQRKARATRRRKSAPDLALSVNPVGQPNFKKEYHNRAERERTRKINSSIQEIRVLTGTGETDKVSILENAVTIVKEINAGTYRPPASVQTGRPVAAPQAMAVAAVGAAAAPAGAAAVGSNAWQTEISPLFDVMHIAAAMVSLDLRITGSNQSMAAVIGCECAELLEQPFLACFHPEDAGHISRTMRHLQQQQHAHTQQVQAQAQLAAQAAAAQATVAQSLDGIATPPLLHVQPHAIAPLQTWEVLTVRVCRRDHSMVPASCRISLVINNSTGTEYAGQPQGFSFLIDGKQEYKQHDF